MLARTPIRAVLRFFNSTTTDDAVEYCSTQYKVEKELGLLTLMGGSIFPWTAVTAWNAGAYVPPDSEIESFYTEYQAGYVWPETTSTEYGTTSSGPTLPADLQQGVLLKAVEIYSNTPTNLLSQSVGDLSITLQGKTIGGETRSQAEIYLAPYRRGW